MAKKKYKINIARLAVTLFIIACIVYLLFHIPEMFP